MLSPRLRQDIFELWTMFWSSGMTNPLTAIEQITYLLFLKRLEQLDEKRTQGRHVSSIYGRRANCELPHHPDDDKDIDLTLPAGVDERAYVGCKGHGTCRWRYIVQCLTVPDPATERDITPHDHLSQYVFPWLRVLEKTLKMRGNGENGGNGLEATASRMEDAYFQLPREKTATLQRAIKTIDGLFPHVDSSDDLMGDIFEYLLSEIETSGKNGQFRTPRHIIRLMVDLVNPDWNETVADPAAGTGGFLINTIQHVLKRYTDPITVRLEWDGTPHRANGAGIPLADYPLSSQFTGYDNDRTMVRIGWMNLILHRLDDPHMILQDTLGKGFGEVNGYDVVLANPPFTGTVDKDDLSERFRDLSTNKSELLFVLLILNLLKAGGRAAVIVPEGVLFGSTNAHKELRRRLLLDNILDGVISLPAGVFQPYTGVKTSILVFHKVDQRCRAGTEPQTKEVWFYEIAADGYTLDARRNPRPEPNDLWDAIEKWRRKDAGGRDYYQPEIYTERWRAVDEKTIRIFSESVPAIGREADHVLGIHELFRELPSNPDVATQQVIERQQPHMVAIYYEALDAAEQYASGYPRTQKWLKALLDGAVREVDRLFDTARRDLLERGKDLPEYGRKAIEKPLSETQKMIVDEIPIRVERVLKATNTLFMQPMIAEGERERDEAIAAITVPMKGRVEAIVREFAKLDGYNIQLRSWDVSKKQELVESKSWLVPVRVFRRDNNWVSRDGKFKGSHDEQGQLRPQYVTDHRLYEADGTVKKEHLDPNTDCIEKNDFNLSAGRYKPFTIATVEYEPPAKIIRELQGLEEQIQEGLDRLLAMVEEEE
jgi:type I restriction enzyme M protein